jgi:hypothetical protein
MNNTWLLLLTINLISSTISELKFVFNIFRHGARGPVLTGNIETDMFGKAWQGDGELTAIGMRMHYLLGVSNKIKYEGFLSKHFLPNELYVMSTYKNRTMMSALSQLNGLYPPETGPLIPKESEGIAVPPVSIKDLKDIQKDLNLDAVKFRAQAVPVHLIPKDSHQFYLHDEFKCPTIKQLRNEYKQREVITKYVKEFKDKYSTILMKELNLKQEFFDSFSNLHILADQFVSGYTEGLDYSFLEKAGINLEELYDICLNNFYIKFSNVFDVKDSFLGHMSMSPFHLSIVEWMDTRVKYDKEGLGYVTYKAPKYIMLSGHDTNLAAIQAYFNKVFPNLFPEYQPMLFAASLYYELHRKAGATTYEPNDYYVEVWYNDQLLFKLDYDEFRSNVVTKSFTQVDIDNYCGFNVSDVMDINTGLIIASSCLAVTSLVLMVIIVVLWRKRKPTQLTQTAADMLFVDK